MDISLSRKDDKDELAAVLYPVCHAVVTKNFHHFRKFRNVKSRDDLVQDCIVAILQGMGRYNGKSSVRFFVGMIANRTLMDLKRSLESQYARDRKHAVYGGSRICSSNATASA